MSQESQQDRLEEIISQAADLGPVQFDRAKWLGRLKKQTQRSPEVHPHAWRRIMNSPYTRIAAVLAIGLAVFSTLFPSRNGLVPESVVLADVRKAVHEQVSASSTGTRTITFAEKPTLFPPGMAKLFEKPANEDGTYTLEFNAESCLSPKGYATKIHAQDGMILMQVAVNTETGKAIFLFPMMKAYVQFDINEEYRQRMAALTIQGFIDTICNGGEQKKLGPKRVAGITAVGFEADGFDQRAVEGFNPYFVKLLFNLQQGKVRAWIDPKTNLPVQSESELKMGPCIMSFFKEAQIKQMDTNMKWDVEIDEAVFRPEIPEDFQKLSLPSNAALGATASGVLLVGAAPWYVLIRRRCCRRRARIVQ